ncbi:hypothetical protein ACQP1O_07075 [Nocardia sp. CA-151230]|uniref:hypothetical protein n=1 Tax=Nocardia sp. CA-151230 TaxID=3239982 RepID=UPI003D934737
MGDIALQPVIGHLIEVVFAQTEGRKGFRSSGELTQAGECGRTAEEFTKFVEDAGFELTDHRRIGDSDRALRIYVATLLTR